ncbi:MAG: tRNA glutamyl-Q(34) synthetase GluQRS [Myxococcota bacterium]
MSAYVGRYAPSPTGDLHLGNLLAAVCAYARARAAGGKIWLRMEDIDTPRVVEGAARRIEEDLAALGFVFDAGPGCTGMGGPFVQSQCTAFYAAALALLRDSGRLYACRCSRRDLAMAASAPHAGEDGPAYPGTCRELGLPFDDPSLPVAWRFVVEPGVEEVEDALQGLYRQDVAQEVGDFVVRRKDGLLAYQLAVVVDDARQGVTEVVRGRDLLSSAPRQAQLFRALGATPPRFAHLPLWCGPDGHRLSKRRGEGTLRTLLARGETPAQLIGRVGRALGVSSCGEPLSLDELVTRIHDGVLRAQELRDDGPRLG